jgi:hypothetical protein
VAEYDSVIPAGESGKIIGKVRTSATQVGRRTKSIRVQTNDPKKGTFNLRISYEIVPVIEVLPTARPRVDVVEGQATEHTVLLRRGDGQPLELGKVQSVLPDVVSATARSAQAGERRGKDLVAEAGDVWLDLVVQAPADGRARSIRVSAATNHPEMARLVIPVVVLVKRLVETRPDQIRLWLGTDEPRYESVDLELRHAVGEAFTVTGAESSHPQLYTVRLMNAEPGPMQRVRVALVEPDEELAGASLRGQIRVATSLESLPEITVPVLVGQRRRSPGVAQTPDPAASMSTRSWQSESERTPAPEPRTAPAGTLREVPTVAPRPTPRPVEVGYGGS